MSDRAAQFLAKAKALKLQKEGGVARADGKTPVLARPIT
jgi:hypothetical protein